MPSATPPSPSRPFVRTALVLAATGLLIGSLAPVPSVAENPRATSDGEESSTWMDKNGNELGTSGPESARARHLEITRQVPAYGGVFVSGVDRDPNGRLTNPGRIQVWITRPSPSVNQQAMEALTRKFPANIQGRPVDFRHADYSFADLTAWEGKLIDLLNRDGVNALGVSQRANKVRIGVDDEDALSPIIEEEANAQDIPLDAIVIDEISTVRPSLQDSHRPLVGGLKIVWSTSALGSDADGACTLGFVAEIDGMDGFITAAHCSETMGSVDGSNYYQPHRGSLWWTNFVGTERIDHAFGHQNHPWCPSGRRCRFADVNFVEENTEILTSLGRVAQPPLHSNNWDGTSTWRVTGNYEPWVGDSVEKIGMVTGWTIGSVLEDCFHYNVGIDITFMCQHVASNDLDFGDSGGPILYWVGWDGAASDVAYSGVLSGLTIWNGEVEAVYSSQFDISWEFIEEEEVSEFHLCHPNHQSWQYC